MRTAELIDALSAGDNGITMTKKSGRVSVSTMYQPLITEVGDVNTNTAESFFALLKRGVHGTFHHISKTHLHRYCDEFSFRWDERKVNDGQRTVDAIKGAKGKRLIYKEAVA